MPGQGQKDDFDAFKEWLYRTDDLETLLRYQREQVWEKRSIRPEELYLLDNWIATMQYGIPGCRLPISIQNTGNLDQLLNYQEDFGGELIERDQRILSDRIKLLMSLDEISAEINKEHKAPGLPRSSGALPDMVVTPGGSVSLRDYRFPREKEMFDGSRLGGFAQMLFSRGVRLSPELASTIRFFRPAMTEKEADDLDPAAAAMYNRETAGSPYEMGDLVLRTLPNTAVREVRMDMRQSDPYAVRDQLADRIKDVLQFDRCPACLTVNGRTYTIMGIDGDRLDYATERGREPVSLTSLVEEARAAGQISLSWFTNLALSRDDPAMLHGLPQGTIVVGEDGTLRYGSEEIERASARYLDPAQKNGLVACRLFTRGEGITGTDRTYLPRQVDRAYLLRLAEARSARNEEVMKQRDVHFRYNESLMPEAPAISDASVVGSAPPAPAAVSGAPVDGSAAPLPAEAVTGSAPPLPAAGSDAAVDGSALPLPPEAETGSAPPLPASESGAAGTGSAASAAPTAAPAGSGATRTRSTRTGAAAQMPLPRPVVPVKADSSGRSGDLMAEMIADGRFRITKKSLLDTFFGLPKSLLTDRGELAPLDVQERGKVKLDAGQQEMAERLRALMRSRQMSTQWFRDGLSGVRMLIALQYMKEHPDKSYVQVMDASDDVPGKRAAAEKVISAMERQAGISWVQRTDGKGDGKMLKGVKPQDDAMSPLIADAMRTLSQLNTRDLAMQCLGQTGQSTADQARAIFSDPNKHRNVREALAALSDFYRRGYAALTACPVNIRAAADKSLSEEEKDAWAHLSRNVNALLPEENLHKLDKGSSTAPVFASTVSSCFLLSGVVRDRLAEKGSLPDLAEDFRDLMKTIERQDGWKDRVLGMAGDSDKDILRSPKCRKLLQDGLPDDVKRWFSGVVTAHERIPHSRTAEVRALLAKAKTDTQIEAIARALRQAAPDIVPEDQINSICYEIRQNKSFTEAEFVQPDYKASRGDTRERALTFAVSGRNQGSSVDFLHPEVLAEMKGRLEDFCNMIDAKPAQTHSGFDKAFYRQYHVELFRTKPGLREALDQSDKAIEALDGITLDRVQTMEDLYARMRAEQSIWHRDSAEYKAMYRAVTAIHERAQKGYNAQDTTEQLEMAKLFADAYEAAQVYAKKEVAGKKKFWQRGLDRKNFTLQILETTAQYRNGQSTWHFPDDFDYRLDTSQNPDMAKQNGLDHLLQQNRRRTAACRVHTVTSSPVPSPAAPAAVPAQPQRSDDQLTEPEKIMRAMERRDANYRALIERHLDPQRLGELKKPDTHEVKAFAGETGLSLDFSDTAAHTGFYAWLLAAKDYSADKLLAMGDSNGSEARVFFDEYQTEMRKRLAGKDATERAQLLGALHRRALEKLADYRYPDEEVNTAADALRAQEKAALIHHMQEDMKREADRVTRSDSPDLRMAYMEGAGGEPAMREVSRQVSASTTLCRQAFALDEKAREREYAERLYLFKTHWGALRGKKLRDCAEPAEYAYQQTFRAHQKLMNSYPELSGGSDTQAIDYLTGKATDLPGEDVLERRIRRQETEESAAVDALMADRMERLTDRVLSPIAEELADFAKGGALTNEKRRQASVLFDRIFGEVFDPEAVERMAALHTDPYEHIIIDGQSVKSLFDKPENSKLTALDREQQMQAAVLAALGSKNKVVAVSTVPASQGAAAGAKAWHLSPDKLEVKLRQTQDPDLNMKHAAQDFLESTSLDEPETEGERVLSLSTEDFLGRVVSKEQERALRQVGRDIFDCLFINGRSVNEIYARSYHTADVPADRAREFKQALFAAARMDEENRVTYRPVDEKKAQPANGQNPTFELLEDGISVGIGDVKGVKQADAQKVSQDARKTMAWEVFVRDSFGHRQFSISDVMGERAEYGVSDLRGIDRAVNFQSGIDPKNAQDTRHTDRERELVQKINDDLHKLIRDTVPMSHWPKEGSRMLTGKLTDAKPDEWDRAFRPAERERYRDLLEKFRELVLEMISNPRNSASTMQHMCEDVAGESWTAADASRGYQMNTGTVQALDELYHRLKAQQPEHSTREYADMLEAMEMIHNAAASYNPQDEQSVRDMKILYREALETADIWLDKEGFREKMTDAEMIRRNAALAVLGVATGKQVSEAPKDLTVIGANGEKKKATNLADLVRQELEITHELHGKEAHDARHKNRQDRQTRTASRATSRSGPAAGPGAGPQASDQ
ncbi:MAG: hypothetical protein K5696_00540 [Lachnospiraceae bacterium]|nr:hypothetical protein [Lachnospiraceae bacterium]